MFIIVLDRRSDHSQADARAELVTIKYYAPGARVVVVQSKCDMTWHDEVDMTALKAEFPDMVAHDKVIRVSGKTGEGMAALQAIVLGIVEGQQEVAHVPEAYAALGSAPVERGQVLTRHR